MSEAALGSVIDYDDDIANAKPPVPLPKRKYRATIVMAEQKMSQKATRYAAVDFKIDASQYPADFTEGNPDGEVITYRMVSLENNPKSRYGVKRFVTAISAPTGRSIDLTMWIGKEAIVEIDHEEDLQGLPRAQIKNVEHA